LQNGELRGINLEYLLKHLQTTVKSMIVSIKAKSFSDFGNHMKDEFSQWKEQSSNNTGFVTPFDTLKANLVIHDQILNNADLTLFNARYQVLGSGTIDLHNKTLEYQVRANLVPDESAPQDLAKFFKTTPLYIQILGPIDNPVIKPDLSGYIQSALQYTQKQTVEDTADKVFKKLFR